MKIYKLVKTEYESGDQDSSMDEEFYLTKEVAKKHLEAERQYVLGNERMELEKDDGDYIEYHSSGWKWYHTAYIKEVEVKDE